MPTSVNYTSLVSDLTNTLERGGSSSSDPTVFEQIPRLINAAERKLMQLLKLQGTIEILRDPVGLPANMTGGFLTKPDRFRQTISMQYGAGAGNRTLTPIFPRSLEYCLAYWPDSVQTAPPEFYADADINHWLIVPTPDFTYPLQVVLYMLPPLLDDANQENFWTRLTPNALLYCSLLEATPFLRDDSRTPVWENLLQIELVSLSGQDLGKIMDRAAERSKP
jgi:hypothetical protein